MSASVVICAYTLDRWEDLTASVASAAGQRPAPSELMLVIDHNPELLARAQSELQPAVPGLRVLANERKRGLSGARNTALGHATCDVVVFLDDDATACDGWLALLLAPYDMPGVVAVGGSASPVWPAGPGRPVTLPEGSDGRGVLDWVVGCTYDGQPTRQQPVRNLMGCNMSMRRETAVLAGGFSEDLGRVGRTPLGCEETELCIRMRERDGAARILFEPSANVQHRVSRDRLTWSYLLRRSHAEGVSKATVAADVGQGAALETERAYVTRVLPRAVARGIVGAAAPGGVGWWRSAQGAVAVLACLAATVGGYARGRLSTLGGRARVTRGPAVLTPTERASG